MTEYLAFKQYMRSKNSGLKIFNFFSSEVKILRCYHKSGLTRPFEVKAWEKKYFSTFNIKFNLVFDFKTINHFKTKFIVLDWRQFKLTEWSWICLNLFLVQFSIWFENNKTVQKTEVMIFMKRIKCQKSEV